MIFQQLAAIAGVSLAVSACTYTANTTTAPARNIVTSFASKVPGKWAVLVEADRLNTTVRSEDLNCSAHTFPINFTQGFPASVRETFPNVFAQVEDAEGSTKGRGVVQVRGENLQSRLKIVPGFWSSNVVVDVDMTVAVTVEGANGRLFGKTFDGRGHADRPACSALVVPKL